MQYRIEFALRQALEARENADGCVDTSTRNEWLKAAALWDAIVRQYQLLVKIGEKANFGPP
jgi:hypothetical protein